MIERMLRREGMAPITCSGSVGRSAGREALDIIDTRPLDAVIIEPHSPGVDGYEVLRHIRSQQVTRSLPVIFVSGMYAKAAIEEALAIGANYYLTKPYNLHDLMHKVRICIAKPNF